MTLKFSFSSWRFTDKLSYNHHSRFLRQIAVKWPPWKLQNPTIADAVSPSSTFKCFGTSRRGMGVVDPSRFCRHKTSKINNFPRSNWKKNWIVNGHSNIIYEKQKNLFENKKSKLCFTIYKNYSIPEKKKPTQKLKELGVVKLKQLWDFTRQSLCPKLNAVMRIRLIQIDT